LKTLKPGLLRITRWNVYWDMATIASCRPFVNVIYFPSKSPTLWQIKLNHFAVCSTQASAIFSGKPMSLIFYYNIVRFRLPLLADTKQV